MEKFDNNKVAVASENYRAEEESYTSFRPTTDVSLDDNEGRIEVKSKYNNRQNKRKNLCDENSNLDECDNKKPRTNIEGCSVQKRNRPYYG